ncbi:MAG: hypothetical protein IJ737_02910 [Ruminococcus sp.]|nr:hypothetical protein [Ruminococcus sp.]
MKKIIAVMLVTAALAGCAKSGKSEKTGSKAETAGTSAVTSAPETAETSSPVTSETAGSSLSDETSLPKETDVPEETEQTEQAEPAGPTDEEMTAAFNEMLAAYSAGEAESFGQIDYSALL